MRKAGWLLFLCIMGMCVIAYLTRPNLSDVVYEFLVENHQAALIECKPLKEQKKVDFVQDSFEEHRISLKSDYTLNTQPPIYLDIILLLPEGAEEIKKESIYQFTSSNIVFCMNVQNAMRFNIEAASELLKNRLHEKQVKYAPESFDQVHDVLVTEKDEVLFIKSLSLKLDDTRTGTIEDALQKSILFHSLRCAYGVSIEPSVINYGSNNLYFFKEFAGAEKLVLEWVLFKSKDFCCAGTITFKSKHNYDENVFDQLIGYLEMILSKETIN
ncbi:MAG TPA: hypothetical protein PKB02_00815 [Anaerohalosphaeraceae bacterium]|nr:hypothetical protein [Anaerohalosphaeraceae bacterium]